MRPGRENLGDAGGAQALFGHAQRCAQPGPAGAYDNDVIFMCLIRISGHISPSERDADKGEKPRRGDRVG